MPTQTTAGGRSFISPQAPNSGNGTATGQVSCVVGAGSGTGGAMLTSGTYTSGVDANANYIAGRIAVSVGTSPTGASTMFTVTLHGGRTVLPKAILCSYCAESNRLPHGIISVRNMALSGSDVVFDVFMTAPTNAQGSVAYLVID